MVAETAPETAVTELPDATPTGDAGGTEVADATEAEVEEFISSRASGKEGDKSSTEPDAGVDELPEVKEAREAAAAAAREEERQKVREETAQSQAEANAAAAQAQEQAAFRQAYAGRAREAYQEAHDAAIELGLDEAQARDRGNKAFQRFNSHHADGLKLFQPLATEQAQANVLRLFNVAAGEVLGKDLYEEYFGTADEPKGHASMRDAVDALRTAFRKDHVTELQAVAREKAAVLAYRRELEKNPALAAALGSTSSARVNGRGATGGWSTKAEARALHVQGKISHEEMRRIRSDPSIPEGT